MNARADARAQAGRRSEWMPYLPASSSPFAPAGVDPAALTWAETVAPGGYTHKVLARGTRLRFDDPTGDACAHLLLFRAGAPWERLNVADTQKIPWQAYLGAGPPAALRRRPRARDGGRGHLAATTTPSAAPRPTPGTARYGDARPEGPSPSGRALLVQGRGQARPRPARPAAEHLVLPGRAGRAGRRARAGRVGRAGHLRRAGRRAAAARARRERRAPARPAARLPGRAAARARVARRAHARRRPALRPHAGARTAPTSTRSTTPSRRSERTCASRTVPVGAVHAPDSPLDWGESAVPGRVVLDERVAPNAPWSAVVRAGHVLTIVDVGGNQSADCLVYDAARHGGALQRPGHARRAGQRLRRGRDRAALQRGPPADDRGGNEIDRQDTIGGACSQGVEHAALRPPRGVPPRLPRELPRRGGAARAGRSGPRLEPQLVHERPRRGRRRARHRRRPDRSRRPGRGAGRAGRAGRRLQLPADEQPLQRLQPDAAAHDRRRRPKEPSR